MSIYYFIPFYLILALIFGFISVIWQIASELYALLAMIGTIIGIMVGIYVLVKSISKTFSTGRIYLLVPGILFLAFEIGAIYIFRQCFCLSEKWSRPSGWGTLMIHDQAVFRWAILITLILSLLSILFFALSYSSEKVLTSIAYSFLAAIILILPLFATHSYCEKEYYKNHSATYEQVYMVKEDVEVKLYVNDSYRGASLNVSGDYDIIRRIFPKKLKKGEIVYGEKMDPDLKSIDVEVFNDNNVIGDVPQEYLEPQ